MVGVFIKIGVLKGGSAHWKNCIQRGDAYWKEVAKLKHQSTRNGPKQEVWEELGKKKKQWK